MLKRASTDSSKIPRQKSLSNVTTSIHDDTLNTRLHHSAPLRRAGADTKTGCALTSKRPMYSYLLRRKGILT